MNFNNTTGLFWIDESKQVFGRIKTEGHFYFLYLNDEIEYEKDSIIFCEIEKEIYALLIKIKPYPENNFFVIDYIIQNCKFSNRNNIKIDNITIKLTNLNYWSLSNVVKTNINDRGCILEIKDEYVKRFDINKNVELEIKQVVRTKDYSDGKFFLNEEPSLTLMFNKLTNFDTIMNEYVSILYKFFRFVIKETNIHEIKIFSDKSIKVYTNFFNDSNQNFNRWNILFNKYELEKYNKSPEKIFFKWFKIMKKLKPVFDVYFSVLNSTLYAETKFLSLMQLLEAYHRRREDKYNLISSDNKNYRDNFPDDIYYELNKKERGHEYNIFIRIRSILTILNVDFINLIINNNLITQQEIPEKLFGKEYKNDCSEILIERHKKIFKFAHIICSNRHYYTHYNKDEPYKQALIGSDLLKVNDYLLQIIDICILYELNFPLSSELKIFQNIMNEKIYN